MNLVDIVHLLHMLSGTIWLGGSIALAFAVLPALVSLPIPNDPAFLGLPLYAQGLLYDPTPGAAVEIGLTEAVELLIGN